VDSVAFTVPLLAGQTDAERVALESCWLGPRREAFQDARRRAGITREAVWIQTTPTGDVAVIYLEADDLGAALALLGSSAEPFDRWFRGHARQVHGVAWGHQLPDVELVLDFDIDRT
jgi:hypothetical protein